jgi:hypothetical protein
LPIKSLPTENPRGSTNFQKEFRSSAAAADEFRGTEVSVLAPCRDGEVPLEPSPSVFITVSAVSIDLTAMSINLAVSYDEEGVFSPEAEGSIGSYVVHLSLP